MPALLALMLVCNKASAVQTVSIGVAAFDDPVRVEQRWQQTINYLNDGQQQYRFELLAISPSKLEMMMLNNELDLLIQNSVKTVQYKERFGASQLLTATPIWNSPPHQAIGSALVMRSDARIDNFEQLARFSAISTSSYAFGGYTAFWRESAEHGKTPIQSFDSLTFVGFPQRKLLHQVLAGDADVAIVPSCLLEQMIADDEFGADSLKVVLEQTPPEFPCGVSSRLYPYFSLSKLAHVDTELATYVVQKLLTLEADAGAARVGRYTRWTVPVDDREVYQLLQAIGLWPFNTNWMMLAQRAFPWVIAAIVVLFLGYLHHLRVKKLVARRTSQLQSEMDGHKKTQANLQEQRSAFYKAQRVLLTGEMASGLAHELNQPLSSIRYLSKGCVLRMEQPQPDLEQVKSGLEKIDQLTNKAETIIKRIKQFCARPSRMSSLAITELLDETLALMEADFRRMRCQVEIERNLQQKLSINGDSVLLQQVLVNLLRNALDAMKDTPETQRRIVVSLCNKSGRFELAVRDYGSGLGDEALARLFMPFETSKAEGLGLGMMICQRIIAEHGGEIWAEHAKPGLTVAFWLPVE